MLICMICDMWIYTTKRLRFRGGIVSEAPLEGDSYELVIYLMFLMATSLVGWDTIVRRIISYHIIHMNYKT